MTKSIRNLKPNAIITESFADKLKSLILFRLAIIAIVVFSAFNSFAQNASELGTTITTMLASADVNIVSEGSKIKSLVYDLQPTIYIVKGNENAVGETAPITADVDAQSVGLLSASNSLFNEVELIIVRIDSPDDLNISLNLSNLSSFGKLKYVVFLSSINCQPSAINNIFSQSPQSSVKVFYTISIER